MFVPCRYFQLNLLFMRKAGFFQVVHSWVGTWPYPETLKNLWNSTAKLPNDCCPKIWFNFDGMDKSKWNLSNFLWNFFICLAKFSKNLFVSYRIKWIIMKSLWTLTKFNKHLTKVNKSLKNFTIVNDKFVPLYKFHKFLFFFI